MALANLYCEYHGYYPASEGCEGCARDAEEESYAEASLQESYTAYLNSEAAFRAFKREEHEYDAHLDRIADDQAEYAELLHEDCE